MATVNDDHPLRPPRWYKEFRQLVRRNEQEAVERWRTQLDHARRIEIVWTAAKSIHLDVLEWSLLKQRPWIDANDLRDEAGLCLLHDIGSNVYATVHKMLAAFQLLVQRVGCRVDVQDPDGRTVLHCVCGSHVKRNRRGRQVYIRLLKLLVDAGANVNVQFQGITPLHLLHESPWAMRYLLLNTPALADVQDNFQRTPLLWSLRNPHLPAVRRIPVSIFRGRMSFTQSDYMGHSLIHYAVLRAQSDKLEDTVRLIARLVDAGADVNHQNRRLRTPMFFLVHKPDMRQLAKSLIQRFNADVNLVDADGFTVVHIAAILGRLDYVTLFLPYLKSNVRTINGETVRSCLEQYCDPSTVTSEVENLLTAMERKGERKSLRVYAKPYTVWEYVHQLDRFRDLLSLYIVDTFFRYRGGRSLFSDFFHHISHSAAIKRRANDFLNHVSQWNGSSKALQDIIDQYSVVIHEDSAKNVDESSQIARAVRQTVQKLMEQVRIKDEQSTKFGWQLDVLPVGSAVDGSKILLPDEYDFLIVFRRFPAKNKLISLGEDYVAHVEQFRLFLVLCMQEMDANSPDKLGFQFVDCELRRVCLNIRMTWWGSARNSPFRGLAISVDLTPVFHFIGWENQSGFRPLRPLESLPDWFQRDQIIEHFRPLHNCVTVPPCAATMEARCLSHSSHRLFQYCLRLLKLIVQSDYIVQDATTPNSHFLKVTLLNYIQEQGPPVQFHDVARYVAGICRKLRETDWRWEIGYFVADARMASPVISLKDELLSVLNRARSSPFSFHDCTLL
ncbi:uncharacterized protein LOC130690989 [Daphnia carinata]|uniref:uncharacterized protein LOC130690989 n=1 Tax=Daphnia carinata TaxID=120202 RepID=UPI00257B0F87|nr:uncharacterized protein LOC130690989 [Daphnia carinata]